MTDIPISRPQISDDEIAAVTKVLRSGHLAAGPRVEAFEQAFARYVEAEHAVAVSNGTSALIVGLRATGIGAGDDVIVPSFTFAATANSVAIVGANLVFAEVDESTYCLTADTIERALTPQVRAVIPVHLYGHPAPMAEIQIFADAHGISVFEDAAQAHGTRSDGRAVGALGSFGAFSFYPTKNMTTGEGGMITTNDPEIAAHARLLRNQGMSIRYHHDVIGTNERMTEIAAAIGLCQLERIEDWNDRRQANADSYDKLLVPEAQPPQRPIGGRHVFHQYTIRPPDRAVTIAALEAAGIGYGIYYPIPTHRQPPYAERVELPVTDRLANEVLSLPIRPDLTAPEIERVADVVNESISR